MVVLGMEHVVDGGQADILVTAPVTRDVVSIEHFVVVRSLVAPRVIAAVITDRIIAIL
jgi:hypothetical protein